MDFSGAFFLQSLIQKQMIIWTLGLVLILSALVCVSLLQPPSTLVKNDLGSGRAPASIPQVAETPQQIKIDPGAQVFEFKVGCESTAESVFAHTIQQVRLRGDACVTHSKKAKLGNAQIKNLTNGSIATVFISEDSRFSTDYINLTNGENRIEIEMTFSDGSRASRTLKFTRENAL